MEEIGLVRTHALLHDEGVVDDRRGKERLLGIFRIVPVHFGDLGKIEHPAGGRSPQRRQKADGTVTSHVDPRKRSLENGAIVGAVY